MPISTSDAATDLDKLRAELLRRAREAGFDDAGIARADARTDLPARLEAWLGEGRHGDMGWMEETAMRRASPATLWPEARSIVMLAMSYGPDDNPLDILAHRDRAAISVYARNRDYHDLVKKRLKQVARWLAETSGAEVKVFVDTAPVMEKPLAEAAGLGWQGKHTNLVSRRLGSWFFLGSIFTTLDLTPDARHDDRCGDCRRCLDICPTSAFPAPYELDARRCISYLTIEHKGHIALEFRQPMGNRIYGCDDCLAVCPWNKFAQAAREAAFVARDDLRAPLLAELATLDDAGFRARFSGSPVKRIGRDRFIRNVLIAIGNTGMPGLADTVRPLLGDASALVRAMAVWALAELGQGDELRQRATAALGAEMDEDVRAEWRRVSG
ncbi:MAG: tRNA epoxyqueuosine(34) reductase QueG [Parvibaculum sp.]|uniref:tRNA epoxyqueuosine(34) reductase QueG n=1 Tax=Parvibaculum sp. TaxID=2024848 RepID=UPI00271EE009|nr:tRNA epoxyqueuosine(34) reductase QueG [Parvibaculum sp.]MDO8839186.1 tRNA epoxyqueuosine(34) reductase QueG [Parvibaculum sp.]